MIPDVPTDFVDLVECLRQEQCEFLVVGAHALAAHGAPRATGDLDVLVRPDDANAARVFRALVRFGAPVAAHGVTSRTSWFRGLADAETLEELRARRITGSPI